MTLTTTRAWDRHAINAEVRRRGMTLTGIAIDAGLHESMCRKGIIGASRAGAEAIAKALDVPFRELFPDAYTRGRHNERNTNRNTRSGESPKTDSVIDNARSVA